MGLSSFPSVASTVMALGLFLGGCQTMAPPAPAPGVEIPKSPAPTVESTPSSIEASSSITPETARNLANNCLTCHGPHGRSPGSIPSLTKLSAANIATLLKRFKNGDVPSTIMERQAKGYTDAEIDAIANYIVRLRK